MGSSASIPNTDVISIQGPMSPFIQEASLIKCAGSFSEQDKESLPVRVSRSDRKTYELRPENVRDTHTNTSQYQVLSPKSLLNRIPQRFSPRRCSSRSPKKRRGGVISITSPKQTREILGRLNSPGKRRQPVNVDKPETEVECTDNEKEIHPPPPQDPLLSPSRRCSFESPKNSIRVQDDLLEFRRKLKRVSLDGSAVVKTKDTILQNYDKISERTDDILARARRANAKFQDLIKTNKTLKESTAKQRWRLTKEKLASRKQSLPSGTILCRRRLSTIEMEN